MATSRDVLHGVSELPEHEAQRLLVLATGKTRSEIIIGCDVSAEQAEHFGTLVERRLADEPLQYIEGSVPFGSIEIQVDDRVLIPRPETELLLEKAVAAARNPAVIVDLCTGSGNLALALKAVFPQAEVFASDLSPDAIAVANSNAHHNGLDVTFVHGDLFDGLPERIRGHVDLLVSNPPYLAEHELADVPSDVRAEPEMALVAGLRGDEVLERIARDAEAWLAPGGLIMCEISEFHGDRITELFAPFAGQIVPDLTGRDRYVFGSRGLE